MTCGLRSLGWAHLFLAGYVLLVAVLLFAAPAHAAPSFSIADGQVAEGNAFQPIATKSGKANSYSKITFTVSPGSCGGSRFVQPPPLTVTVGNSQLTAYGPKVATIANQAADGDCTVKVTISAVRFATIARATATWTVRDDDAAPAPPPGATWTRCAIEDGICNIVGTANVRYGSGSVWTAPRSVTTSILCNNGTWGDPIPYTTKECQTDGQVGTAPTPTPTPPTPPPATGSWAPAPLALGGYAFLKNGGPCCNGAIFRIVSVALSSDADPARRQNVYGLQFAADPSGQYPASSTAVSYAAEEYVVGVAPQ